MTMDEAWAEFDKAVSFEAKAARSLAEGKDGLARVAGKAVEKHLDAAVRLEAEAIDGAQAVAA